MHNVSNRSRTVRALLLIATLCGTLLSAAAPAHAATTAPTADVTVNKNGTGAQTTAPFTTSAAGEWLVTFVRSDGPATSASQSATVSGAGLSWSLVRRTNARFGTAEAWTAFAPGVLSNATVTSTPLVGGFHQAVTVVAFAGSSGVGASSSASGASGAPSVGLTTTQANSLVYAAGNDWDRAVARTVPATQTMVNQIVDTATGDTYWVQRQTAAVAAPGAVTINDTAPINDQWNYAAVEIKGVATAAVPTTTVVTRTAGPSPSVFGQSVTFTAAVSSGSGTATGSAQFKDGTANLGAPVALVGGQASLTTAALTAGSHSIAAVYSGDTNFATSTSVALAHTVNPASTSTAITSDAPDPSNQGQAYMVQWSTTVTAPGAGIPTGNVTVNDGTDSCVAAVAVGQCSLTSTTGGAKTLTATYAGDTNFTTSAGTTGHTVIVVAPTTTVVTRTAGPNPSVFGQSVTFTATVSSGSGTPTGSVQFKDGAANLGAPVTLAGGQASLTTTALTVTSHSITAVYSGDTNFAGSTSVALPHTVAQASTATAISNETPDPTVVGQGYTVSFAVTVTAPGAGTPTGSVTVSDGTASCSGTVAAGSCVLGSPTSGAKNVIATYVGNTNFSNSISPPAAHTVNQASTATAVARTAGSNPSSSGQSVTFTATVSVTAPGAGNATGTVQFMDGAANLGAPVTLAGGQAALATTTLTVGTHSITAVYAGDANFTTSTSPVLTQTVNAGPSVPGAPTAVTATAANASATVFWTAPASGGSPITSYKITPFIGSTAQATTTVSGSPPASSAAVYGLVNGTAYTFQVTATNAIGTGPASAASNSVTPLASALTLPNLKVLTPTSAFSIATVGATKFLRYTHQTENAGTGPFELRPSYNSTTGISTFAQALYTSSSPGVWQFAQTVALPHNGVFNPPDDYAWPLSGFTLYAQAAGGGLGAQAAVSAKTLFCITHDAYIGDVPNTPASPSPLYDPSHCDDPNGVLGMSVGWADQYDNTDAGQSIDITTVPNGTYILRAIADPLHLVVESNKTDNTSDTVISISGNTVTVLGQSNPTVIPPSVAVTSPASGSAVSGNVPLAVSTSGLAAITSVQYLLDGNPIGAPVTTAPFSSTWTVGSTPPGQHWLSAQATDANGSIGTASQVIVNVAQTVGSITIENQVTKNGTTTVTTPAFSTTGTSELLVATVGADAVASGQTAVVSGAGLTWTRVARANTRAGDAEIWTAVAPAPLTGVTVTSTAGTAGFSESLTVMAILGSSGTGATNTAGAASGAPSISFASTRAGSFGIAVGNDGASATARVLGAGQTLISQYVDTPGGNTFWTQDTNAATASVGQTVTLNDTGPTGDAWNLAAVEVLPAGPPPPDTTNPTASIATPAAGQTVSNTVPVTANASDNVAVANVQLLLDGAPLGSLLTTPPYSVSWDTTTATNGTHVIGARATDTSGNIGTATTVTVTVQNPAPPMVCFFQDVNVKVNGLGTVTTPTFHTGMAGELLLAFAASDGPLAGKQTLTVSGSGLTWTLIKRANTQAGTAEIWSATAPAIITNGTVTATQSSGGYYQSLNVIAMQGTNGLGPSASASAASGAPTVSVTTTHPNSLIFGVGDDWDNAIARTTGPNQSLLNQYLAPSGDTFWSQYTTVQAGPAGSVVTLNDTAPTTDRYNIAAVEVIGAAD